MSDFDFNEFFSPSAVEPEKVESQETKFEVFPEGNFVAKVLSAEFSKGRSDKDGNSYDAFSAKFRFEAPSPIDLIGKNTSLFAIYSYPKYPDLAVTNAQKIKRLIYAAGLTQAVTPENAAEIFNFATVGITIKHVRRKVKGSNPVQWETASEIADFYKLESQPEAQEPNLDNGAPATSDDAPW